MLVNLIFSIFTITFNVNILKLHNFMNSSNRLLSPDEELVDFIVTI